jgi:hypothetical protein
MRTQGVRLSAHDREADGLGVGAVARRVGRRDRGGERVYHGREGFVRGVRELTETFDDFHIEVEEFIDLGERT